MKELFLKKNIAPDWLRIQASQELTILSFHLWYAYSPTRATKDHMQYTMIWYTHRCSQCSLFLSSLVRLLVACMRIELIVFVLLARRSNQLSHQATKISLYICKKKQIFRFLKVFTPTCYTIFLVESKLKWSNKTNVLSERF